MPTFDRMAILLGEEPRQTKGADHSAARERFAQPGEIADAVLHLSSHESGFIMGTDLAIDGGRIQLW